MKCPLLKDSKEGNTSLGDCYKEKCAWWDTATKQCAIQAIAKR